MVTFINDKGDIKELADIYGKSPYINDLKKRGFVLKGKETPKVDANELVSVRKGDDNHKLLVEQATNKSTTIKEIESTYKVSGAVKKELEILLNN